MVLNLTNNMDFADVLWEHAKRYPAMTPQDAVKLIYQATFGVGHLLADAEAAYQRIYEEENAVVPAENCPAIENIGGGYMRLYLNRGISSDTIASLFLEAGTKNSINNELFAQRLEILRGLTENGVFSFDAEELETYLDGYLAFGFPPPVSHSEDYRTAYRPAYRVVSYDMAMLLPLLDDLDARIRNGVPTVLVIDGFCASGKSTLAARLSDLYGARLINMDDFFLPPSKRTPERFAEPGGNVDYERFHDEVIAHLNDEVLTYGVFDCSEMAVTHRIELPKTPLTIIEGAYALHPHFGNYADIRAFMETDEAEQKRRILARDGAEMLEMFESRWIPFERNYEAAYGIRESCGYHIHT